MHPDLKREVRDIVEEAIMNAAKNPVVKSIEEIEVPEKHDQELDYEQVFQLYAIYCGDVARTALASGWSAQKVNDAAIELRWNEKLKVLIDLKESTVPGDSERGINRAINFVQAHRYRIFLERILMQLSSMSRAELADVVCGSESTKSGEIVKRLSLRPFADLGIALDKCHSMTYQALTDTATDRKERKESPTTQTAASEIHLKISQAMAQVREAKTNT